MSNTPTPISRQLHKVQASAHQDQVEIDLGLLTHVLMMSIMMATIAKGLSSFFDPVTSLVVGMALGYTFSRLVKIALGLEDRDADRSTRACCAASALAVGCISLGLSYSTIYGAFFGSPNAISSLEVKQRDAMRQTETVIADAQFARSAMTAWFRASSSKAEAEYRAGGTCPSRPGTGGARGPIFDFRKADAELAGRMAADVKQAVEAIESAARALPVDRSTSYEGALAVMRKMNALIREVNGLTKSSMVESMIRSLQDRESVKITWSDGSSFDCGDPIRSNLIANAKAALQAIQKRPVLPPIGAEIDLNNPQEVSTRGLLRVFNCLVLLASLGTLGGFRDDPLMVEALKAGVINRETLPIFLAMVIEVAVVASAYFAKKKGKLTFPPSPHDSLVRLDQYARNAPFFVSVITRGFKQVWQIWWNLISVSSHARESSSQEVSDRAEATTMHPSRLSSNPHFDPLHMNLGRDLGASIYWAEGRDVVAIPSDGQAGADSDAHRARECLRLLAQAGLSTHPKECAKKALMGLPDFARRWGDKVDSPRQFEIGVLESEFSLALRRLRLVGHCEKTQSAAPLHQAA